MNPPRIAGATLSACASPDATFSPLAAIQTSSSFESPLSYKAFRATAVPAALAAEDPSPEAGLIPLLIVIFAGASRASANGSSHIYN